MCDGLQSVSQASNARNIHLLHNFALAKSTAIGLRSLKAFGADTFANNDTAKESQTGSSAIPRASRPLAMRA